MIQDSVHKNRPVQRMLKQAILTEAPDLYQQLDASGGPERVA
jgi:hypothetical protein